MWLKICLPERSHKSLCSEPRHTFPSDMSRGSMEHHRRLCCWTCRPVQHPRTRASAGVCVFLQTDHTCAKNMHIFEQTQLFCFQTQMGVGENPEPRDLLMQVLISFDEALRFASGQTAEECFCCRMKEVIKGDEWVFSIRIRMICHVCADIRRRLPWLPVACTT